MIEFLKKLISKDKDKGKELHPEEAVVVIIDDEKILCKKPNANDESITWSKLDAVLIETTDEGPVATDVFWLLLTKDMSSGCIIPQGAKGENELLAVMQSRLTNFNNELLIEAMGSTDNKRFLLWERKDS
jgi:hypothetical protein